MNFILLIISFILIVILISLIGLDSRGKVNLISPVTVYPFLTLFPFFLLAIPILFIISLCISISENYLSIVLAGIIIMQITLLSLYMLIKINIITSKNLKVIDDLGKRNLRLKFSKKLLSYSIYTAIFYSICIALLIIKCYSAIPAGTSLSEIIFLMILSPLLMIIFPLAGIPAVALTIAAGIVITVIIVTICVVVILSLNGTIRTIFLLPKVKEKWIFYILIMLIPLANIVCMFHLRNLVNKELTPKNN